MNNTVDADFGEANPRYRVERASGGYWPCVVLCGTGTRVLFRGFKKACEEVASELNTAFKDGEFSGMKIGEAASANQCINPQGLLCDDGGHQFCPLSYKMNIEALFAATVMGVEGQTPAKVKRVRMNNDGSLTVCIDHWPTLKPENQAAADVLAERRRQIEAEDWSTERDDMYRHGELARAAGVYALIATMYDPSRVFLREYELDQREPMAGLLRKLWPWDGKWLKLTTRRRDLVKAGALIIAEIERLDRAEARKE